MPATSPLTLTEAMTQIGTTDLRWVGPYMREEFLTELQGAPACPSDEKPR